MPAQEAIQGQGIIMLKGKKILVTGASRGIGAAIVEALLAAGATPIAHASGPSEAAASLSAKTGVEFIFEDLGQVGAGDRLVERACAIAGAIDGLVNNAGVYLPTPLSGGDEWTANWQSTFAVNVQAPADISRAAIAHFRSTQKAGRIVNISSRAAQRGDGMDYAAYAASKGALQGMTKTWARALAGEQIYLYAIAPGWVDTRMGPQGDAGMKHALSEIPLGRIADVGEIAALATFLLSDACTSATGATFDVNGASYVR